MIYADYGSMNSVFCEGVAMRYIPIQSQVATHTLQSSHTTEAIANSIKNTVYMVPVFFRTPVLLMMLHYY